MDIQVKEKIILLVLNQNIKDSSDQFSLLTSSMESYKMFFLLKKDINVWVRVEH